MDLGVSKQNFHSKGVGGPTGDSGSRVTARHVELGLLAIPGSWTWTTRTKRMEIRIGHKKRVLHFFGLFFFLRCGKRDMICGDVWAGVVG